MPLCPNCSSEVAATDSHCMDCGTDLIAAREKGREVLREQSVGARSGSGPTTAPANPAAAGIVDIGESSEETRIRAFDRQEAERLAEERKTAWVTSGIALVLGIVLAFIGLSRIKAGGGFGEITADLKPVALRSGGLTDPTVIGVMVLGLGLAGVLVGVGQARLAVATTRAIRQVKSNLRPDVVQISTFTLAGLFMLCIFCPPVGLIVGLLMLFGRNPDLKALGSNMTMVSVGIMVLLGANMLWKLAENMKPAAPASTPR